MNPDGYEYPSLGFAEATLNQLKVIDHLVHTRQLNGVAWERMDRWVDGYNTLTVDYIVSWLKEHPMREDLPSGVLFP